MGPITLSGLFPVVSDSPARTRKIGATLAGLLPVGSTVALKGDLGTGKTVFVRGLVEGLGGSGDDVTSPTFTIAQEYAVPDGVLIHVDAYRVTDPREFLEMGLEDYVATARLTAIEWPDRMGELLPDNTITLRMTHASENLRRIDLVHS